MTQVARISNELFTYLMKLSKKEEREKGRDVTIAELLDRIVFNSKK